MYVEITSEIIAAVDVFLSPELHTEVELHKAVDIIQEAGPGELDEFITARRMNNEIKAHLKGVS